MAVTKPTYQTAQALTFTSLANLANNSACQCTAVDNTTNNYDDYKVMLTLETASGTIGTNPVVNVFVAEISDGGNWPDAISGTDGSYTMLSPTNLRLLDVVNIPASATLYRTNPRRIAQLFGGVCPDKFVIVVQNQTGLALAASGIGGSVEGVIWTTA